MLAYEKKQGSAATQAKNRYNAKAYDRFLLTVQKGQKEEIEQMAKSLGYKSRNEFIVDAIYNSISDEEREEIDKASLTGVLVSILEVAKTNNELKSANLIEKMLDEIKK